MNKLRAKRIELISVVKTMSFVMAVVGIVVGIIVFFITPNELARNLSLGTRLLSWLVFVAFYALLTVAGLVFIAFVYNHVSKITGGLVIDLEEDKI
ncbi:MAG: hypothetical protein ABII64_00530 [Elusimicrobiota bacterium]